MVRRRAWRRALPDFDCPEWCWSEWQATANALHFLGWDNESVRNCHAARPCRSGLCAMCMRQLRVRLLNFLEDEELYRRNWHLVTIRVEGWKVAPGDCAQFEALREHPGELKGFRRKDDGVEYIFVKPSTLGGIFAGTNLLRTVVLPQLDRLGCLERQQTEGWTVPILQAGIKGRPRHYRIVAAALDGAREKILGGR